MKPSALSLLSFAAVVSARAFSQGQVPLRSAESSLSIPLLGFGTWNLDGKDHNASEAVAYAIEAGYRHIDCAAAYRNEKDVGKGIKEGLKRAGLKREDIWVTSKLWNDHHDGGVVPEGLEETLSDLGLDYLDLYLMHWPVAQINDKYVEDYLDTWHAMEVLVRAGKVRHIGVSNFSPKQLRSLIDLSATTPFAHQMELHPYLPQTEWVQFHQAHGIHVTAYSPLGNTNPTYGGKAGAPPFLGNEVVVEIAERRNCTPATVALAWGRNRGTSAIPKSQHESRIKENLGKCELQYEDLVALRELAMKNLTRFNNPSKTWGVDLYEGLEGS